MEAQGERRYSSYSFMIAVVDGVSGQRHSLAALYPQEKDPYKKYGKKKCAGEACMLPCLILRATERICIGGCMLMLMYL
jgi:hypothetical protein